MATLVPARLSTEDVTAHRTLVEEDWVAEGLARDWDRLLGICAQDLVYMPPDHSALRGHAAFRGWLEQFPTIVKLTQRVEQVDGQTNLGVVRATLNATVEVGGQHLENTGKVLAWFEKGASGTW